MSIAALQQGTSRSCSPEARALARQIERKCRELDQQTHFEVLGISPASTREQIWAAHALLSRLFDPERLVRHGLHDLRAAAERIRARLATALAVLTDQQQHADQLALLAERALVDSQFDAAIDLGQRAAQLVPDEAGYQARLAWLYYHHPSRPRAQVIEAVRRHMARTLELAPARPEPYAWLGEIYLADRKYHQAIECFRWALALRGGYPEAERGLHLAFERQREHSP